MLRSKCDILFYYIYINLPWYLKDEQKELHRPQSQRDKHLRVHWTLSDFVKRAMVALPRELRVHDKHHCLTMAYGIGRNIALLFWINKQIFSEIGIVSAINTNLWTALNTKYSINKFVKTCKDEPTSSPEHLSAKHLVRIQLPSESHFFTVLYMYITDIATTTLQAEGAEK